MKNLHSASRTGLKKALFSSVSAVLAASLLAGCGFSGASSTAAPAAPGAAADSSAAAPAAASNALVTYGNAEITTLQQWDCSDNGGFNVLNQAFEGLYRSNAEGEAAPALAESYDLSEDGCTYTFHLRDGLQWSNGTPLTANDFVFSWLKQMSSSATNGYAFIMTDYVVNGAEYNADACAAEDVAVSAPDDKTFVVTLKAPCNFFVRLTTLPMFFPLNQEFVDAQGTSYATAADKMIYCGPYCITNYDAAAGVTMAKNEKYWDAANVAVENAEIKVIKESATALNAFLSGNLTRVKLDSTSVAEYSSDPRFTSTNDFRTDYLQFNLNDEVMQNVNIRKAISAAVDTATLASSILCDGSVGATGMIPTGMYGDGTKTFREMNGDVTVFDAAKAKEYWDAGCAELGTAPTKVTLLVKDDSVTSAVATFVQDQIYSNLGVECVIDTKTTKERGTLMDQDNYQFAITAWGADYDDAMTYLDLWTGNPSTPYRGNYLSTEYCDLIAAAKTETDEAVRTQEMLDAEKLLCETDCVVSPLYYRGAAYLTDANVQNLVSHQFGVDYEFKYASFN